MSRAKVISLVVLGLALGVATDITGTFEVVVIVLIFIAIRIVFVLRSPKDRRM